MSYCLKQADGNDICLPHATMVVADKVWCRVFVGGNAPVPHALVQHLIDNSEGFSDIELVH